MASPPAHDPKVPLPHDPRAPLPLQPRDDDGLVFREPWEAQVFAMAVRLHAADYFTWPEWTEALSSEITAAKDRGEADLGDTYYHHWTRALERALIKSSLVDDQEIERRIDAWREAYANTPHGHAVLLSSHE